MNNSPDVYKWVGPTGVHFTQIKSPAGTYYHEETPQAVRDILDRAIQSGQRLRLFTGDTKTGECWNDEYDTIGEISRSMGPIKIPILIKSSRSTGGGAILDSCIIAIQNSPGHFIYKHPHFSVGRWEVGPAESDGYVEAAYHNRRLHAQFKRSGQADRYIAFMKGERWAK